MDYLRGKNVYLSGPIDKDPDQGKSWRSFLAKYLQDTFFLKVTDPLNDPKQNEYSSAKLYLERKNYDEVNRIAKNFVRKDLGLVDRQDFIIVVIKPDIPTYGTTHEIINAINQKKPCLIVCEQGKSSIPLWLYGIINHKYMFSTFLGLFKYLDEIDNGVHRADKLWQFVCGEI